jgi:hypothetical protein
MGVSTTKRVIVALAVALGCLIAQPARGDVGTVQSYPLAGCYTASETFSVRANGKAVPVGQFSKQYEYVAFAVDGGPCKIEITRLDGKPIKKHSISPLKLSLAGNVAKSTLAFSIAKPVYLIVSVDDLRKLVVAVDPGETEKPRSSGNGIYNVTAAPYSADPTGAKPATEAIQRAFDDAGKDSTKKGLVYVPAGVFNLTELKLGSDVSLYLEGGAVLRCDGARDELKVRYRKKSQNRDGTWFIYTADGAKNVRIFGRGTIDANGNWLEHERNLTNHAVLPMNCTGFVMDGPVIRDSGLWGVVVANSKNVSLRNTKHFNHLDRGEDDCIDICNSQDVRVERSIAISLDDPYSTKTWAPDNDLTRQWTGSFEANRNVVMDDCVAWTRCFGFKIGAGVWRDQENITIKNTVVYDSAHAIGISHSYGSKDVRNVVFDTMDVERNTMTNLGRSWARFWIDDRKKNGDEGGSVYDIVVKNIRVRDAGTEPVPVRGLAADKKILGIRFENIVMPNRSSAATSLAQIGGTEKQFADQIVLRVPSGASAQSSTSEKGRLADADPSGHTTSGRANPEPSERAR